MQLQIRNLSKIYGDKKAVNNVNLTLTNGVYGLLGANGAGKSTFMKMLCDIQTSSSGKITLNEKNIKVLGEKYREKIGYLPQNFSYYPDFTVFDFLMYVSSLKGLEKSKAVKKSKELIDIVGLKAKEKEKMKNLSGGMKQRVGIAQAMLNEPQILILDEPTAGLDPKERVNFRNLISAFSKDRIVILSTHIVSDIEYIAEKIILMKDGEILHFGKPNEITSEIDNYVFECTVPSSEVDRYTSEFNVANLKNIDNNRTILRIVSNKAPMPNAQRVNANLEDLYLYYFRGRE